jgi:excisionase family DNA binding protein
MADLRDPARRDRREGPRRGGRRATDTQTGSAWTTGQLAFYIGMSRGFVLGEIRGGEIIASQFGREYRIAAAEVKRYLSDKRFPLPDALA